PRTIACAAKRASSLGGDALARRPGPGQRGHPAARSANAHTAAISAAIGMVRIQAHTMRPATPHLTADSSRVALTPTPTIAPAMVWVVDTGIPAAVAPNSVIAPAVSAQNPPTGRSFVMFMPMVFT